MSDSRPHPNATPDAAARDARDAALVVRIRAGDPDALATVFREYAPALMRFAHAHIESREAAEEIVQELFLSLWRRRFESALPLRLERYLYTAVHNRVRNYRRDQRTARLAGEALLRYAVSDDGPSAPADHTMAELDVAEAVRDALATLPAMTRDIFVLNRDQHLTYRAIAERLGVSVKTVEYHMGRAFRTLRAALAEWRR